jgi:hypothetical protein
LKRGIDVWNFFATFAGPIATVIASTAAFFVAWRFGAIQAEIARGQAQTAKGQLRIADGQGYIATARFNLDLYEKRYAIFDAARRLLLEVVQHDHVKPTQVIKFNVETADAEFLFDKDVGNYLDALRNKILRLRVLKAQEKAADEAGDEEKRIRLVDLESDQHIDLSNELPALIEKFKPYLKFGNLQWSSASH